MFHDCNIFLRKPYISVCSSETNKANNHNFKYVDTHIYRERKSRRKLRGKQGGNWLHLIHSAKMPKCTLRFAGLVACLPLCHAIPA